MHNEREHSYSNFIDKPWMAQTVSFVTNWREIKHDMPSTISPLFPSYDFAVDIFAT